MNANDPKTLEDILAAVEDLRVHGLTFWRDFTPDKFAAPIGDAWSPADNIRHLIKSTLPVTKAFKLPALVLRTLFGTAKEASLSYSDLVSRYKAILDAGGTAGRFAPRMVSAPTDIEQWQVKLISVCSDSLSDLSRAASRWSEAELDRYRLPHPLLGKITLREMLFFTHYDFSHHKGNVVRRLRLTEPGS